MQLPVVLPETPEGFYVQTTAISAGTSTGNVELAEIVRNGGRLGSNPKACPIECTRRLLRSGTCRRLNRLSGKCGGCETRKRQPWLTANREERKNQKRKHAPQNPAASS